jgi:hypothetical protein
MTVSAKHMKTYNDVALFKKLPMWRRTTTDTRSLSASIDIGSPTGMEIYE